jgi:hypothetical protein
MNSQNPEDLGILLHDRRDLLRFWTFWAVIGIGGISIVLAFLQMVLAIVQIVV